jgi:hypothetical protein
MKTKRFGARAVILASALMLPSCFTVNGVEWTYGKTSVYKQPDADMEQAGVRAIVGLPLIVTSIALDAVTWPFQLAFGVWPMWGDSSTMARQPVTD